VLANEELVPLHAKKPRKKRGSLVEAVGIEPTSEERDLKASTCV